MKKTLNIVKIGGAVTENSEQLSLFLNCFSKLKGLKLLVHGGGKKASFVSKKMGLQPYFIEGRRVTDANTLEVATMVYAGIVNKTIVASLQGLGVNALGLSGADANIIKTVMRDKTPVDYGYVGDFIENSVNKESLLKIMKHEFVPVLCSLTHDGQGQLLNTNADTIAGQIAIALIDDYLIKLHYCFEHNGILKDINNQNSTLQSIEKETYTIMKQDKTIHSGLIPKIENAFICANQDINVRICHFTDLTNPKKGTKIITT